MALKYSIGFPGYHDTTIRFLKEARQARLLCTQSLRNGFKRVECVMEAMRNENPERLLFALLKEKAVDTGLQSNEEEVKVNDTRYDHSFAMLVGGYMEEGDTVTFGKKVVILMKKRRRSYASGSLIPQWVQYMVIYREKKLTSAALFNAVKDGFLGVYQVIGRLKRIVVCSFMYEGFCGEGSQEIATFIGRLVVDLLVTTTMSYEEATDFMMKLADDLPTDSNAAETLRLAKLLIQYTDKGVVRRCWIGRRVVYMDSPEMKEIEMMIEQVLLEENEDEKKNKEKVDEAMTRVKQLLTPYWNSQIVSEILKNVVAIYIDNTNVRKRLFDCLNLCCREGVITAAMMKAGFNKFKKDILARFESYSICLKEAEKLGWFTEE